MSKHSHGSNHGASRGSNTKMGEGDWLCSDTECANWNFAWRTSCNRCGAEKSSSSSSGSGGDASSYSKKKKLGQEIGKAMAEKSRGLFSADDWQCNKCGNVNWARRHQCNVCNAPRFGEVEERTGYGGGYNDRGTVEYVERKSESDDEWDEFGRKKKKKSRKDSDDGPSSKRRRGDRSDSESEEEEEREKEEDKSRDRRQEASKVEPVKPKEPVKEKEASEEDDEEEEDDDDGDLSKYDLSGWGDEEEGEKKDDK